MGLPSFSVRRQPFGTLPSGEAVEKITLQQAGAASHPKHTAEFTNYGGRWLCFTGPDRDGVLDDVIRGPATLEECLVDTGYAGALIGRFANRIAGASFALGGMQHSLAANAGEHTLHGGACGFDRALWQVVAAEPQSDCAYVELVHHSPDGDQGFPGNLEVHARYTLLAGGKLELRLAASTDRTTVINLTAHPYFNLSGHDSAHDDCLGHLLQLSAESFLGISPEGIPEGHPLAVAETPFDFRHAHSVGERFGSANLQLAHGHGYDHYFQVDNAWPLPASPVLHAVLQEPQRGRELRIHSTLPGLQFYTGNFLGQDSTAATRWRGHAPAHRSALCLEPQFPPNAPNRPDFPSTCLSPGGAWQHVIVYELGVMS